MDNLRIGVAGIGTVGGGLLQLLTTQKELIEQRCRRPLTVVAVSARDQSKDRDLELADIKWHEDATSLAVDPNVDVVVN